MSCPDWSRCDRFKCHDEGVCQNSDYWVNYWKNKTKTENETKYAGLSKKDRRKARKAEKKAVGIKRYHRERKEEANREWCKDLPLCVKNGDWCDKKAACEILSQCIITISRFQGKPELLEALRGPKTIKEIIRILAKHDPEPMGSYYMHSRPNDQK